MTGGLDAWKAAGYATEIQILPPDSAPKEAPAPVFLCPPPGNVLNSEYLTPLGIPQSKLADAIGVSEDTIAKLISHDATIDVELSLRLARYFSTAGDFWIRLQTEHDLEQARYKIGEEIRQSISPRTATE